MKRDSTAQSKPEHIGSVLPRVLREFRPPREGDLGQIEGVWKTIVGTAVAENARPYAVKGGVVLVHVSSSVWIHHLRFLRQDIVDKINNAIGTALVEELKFKIGPLE
ncbi:MAG: DUF721 domain-containing protein [Desulfobacteraceae bacterium]|jgi:predicted nucleic acid-binding Zn ribbon protein|nr:DUF721 domain-containing protein [Desulfobacteraceae bacterium]